MMGLIAALLAVYLGAFGPRFRWRGACLLAGAAIGMGCIATISVARSAADQGLQFGISPASLIRGLMLQAVFMLSFYGMAALAGWSARQLTSPSLAEVPDDGRN